MAAFTSKATGFWDAVGQTTWNEVGAPVAGDTVEIQVGDVVTLQQAEACATLLMTDGELDVDTFNLTVSGNYTQNGGTMSSSGGRVLCGGNVVHSGSTAIQLDLSMTNTGATKTLDWSSASQVLVCLRTLPGVTIDLPGFVFSKAYDIQGDDITSGTGKALIVSATAANDWWSQSEGSLVSVLLAISSATNSPGGDITLNDTDLQINTNSIKLITIDGDVATGTGDILVLGDVDLDGYTVIFERAVQCGLLKLGSAGGAGFDGYGRVTINGTLSISSLAKGNAANVGNQLNLGPGSYVECSGSMDLDNITLSGNAAFPAVIVCPAGGEVLNTADKGVDFATALHGDSTVDSAAGVGNHANISDYTNNQSYPGSLRTMGIGGGSLIVPFWLMGMVTFLKMAMGMF